MAINIKFIDNPKQKEETTFKGNLPLLLHDPETGHEFIGLIAQIDAGQVRLVLLSLGFTHYTLNRLGEKTINSKAIYNRSDFDINPSWIITQPKIDITVTAYVDQYE